jgi:hypothetical protein
MFGKPLLERPPQAYYYIYVHPWAKKNAKKEGDRVFRFLIGQGKIQYNLLFYFVILKSTKFEARHVYKLQEKMVKREYAKELGEKSSEWYGMTL